jgi:uncharacterized protein YabE (DUF348 family)
MTKVPEGPARFLKTHYLLILIVTAAIAVASITGFVWADKSEVTVFEDGAARSYRTDVADVAALLDEVGIAYGDSDIVDPAPDTPLLDGMSVTVRHAIPVVLALADGEIELDVIGTTVSDALVAAGLGPADRLSVSPALDVELEPGMRIGVADVFVRVEREEADIPFETVTRDDPTLAIGVQEVETEGVPGRKEAIYEVVVTDGIEGARTLTSERVLSLPVDQVVLVGTKRTERQLVVSRAKTREAPAAPPASGTELSVSSTAYTPGYGCGYYTATGARAGFGIVAVDPSVIPLGTKLYVPGYGYGVAADTGGAIKGNKIDVCFDTRSEALAWGRRNVTVTILP